MMTLKSLNGLNQIWLKNEFLMRGVLCVAINANIIVGIMTGVKNGNAKSMDEQYTRVLSKTNK